MTLTISENETRSISPHRFHGLAADENEGWPGNWISEARRAFVELLRLSSDWDGQGAASPDSGLVIAAYKLVDALAEEDCPRPTAINPTPSGGVQIEWEQGAKYLEVELLPNPLRAMYFIANSDKGQEDEGIVQVDGSLIDVLRMAQNTCGA